MFVKKILISFCFIPSLILGLSFESDKMEDLLPYVDEHTWVLIDVDNTLIESGMHLGSAQWRPHLRQKVREAGYEGKQEEAVIDGFWLFIQPLIPVHSVDPQTPHLISQLKQSNVVLGLTARDPVEVFHTPAQLHSSGIDLSNDIFADPLHLGVSLYDEGVIYSGDNTKFEALNAFFKEAGIIPKKVVFVDDKWDQVEKMESGLEKMGIEFVGMRFSGADARVASFDPVIADVQFCMLPRLVSDEEAEEMINSISDQ